VTVPCPGCDAAAHADPLVCLALGVSLGAAFTDMHDITELMCRDHRTRYVMAMMRAQVAVNTEAGLTGSVARDE
jgi:hypothetical protein